MNRYLCWIDAERLDAALRRAGVPVRGAAARPAPRAGPSAGSFDLMAAPPALRQDARHGAGLQPALRTDAAATEPFRPPDGNLQERLQELLGWIRRQTGCRRVFVLDEEGLVVMEHSADPDLIAVSSSFASFQERIRSCLGPVTQGSIAIDLEGGDILRLLEASTQLGRFVLGVVVKAPLSATMAHALRIALEKTMEDDGPAAPQTPAPGSLSGPKNAEGV